MSILTRRVELYPVLDQNVLVSIKQGNEEVYIGKNLDFSFDALPKSKKDNFCACMIGLINEAKQKGLLDD